jgi:predicted Rossmann fold nucleotide-binding protein DprA/Smf involved in DNA uptake
MLPDPSLTEDEQLVLKLLGPQPRTGDDLIAESGTTTARVQAALTLLELKGLARKASGTTYVRIFGRVMRDP